MQPPPASAVRIVGRYALHAQIASGGMASVHLGRVFGQAGFSRTVAIKRLHPHLAANPEFVSMLIDEARLAARVRHPNVVATLDVVALDGELLVVMEYVHGESFAHLLRKLRQAGERVPASIAVAVMGGVLYGLHAAHEATNERGAPLGLIHRDVSPQNIMVGADGVARVVDFGVAKAAGRLQETHDDALKGKIRYMAPEQILRKPMDRASDVYSASVVLWEALVGQRLFEGDNDLNVAHVILEGASGPPSAHAPSIPPSIDAIVMRGLDPDATARFATAFEMAAALEEALTPATARQVAHWVQQVVPDVIQRRAAKLAEVEGLSADAPVIELDSSSDMKPVWRGSSPELGGASSPSVTTAGEPSEPSKSAAGTWAASQVPPAGGLKSVSMPKWAAIGAALTLVVGLLGLLLVRALSVETQKSEIAGSAHAPPREVVPRPAPLPEIPSERQATSSAPSSKAVAPEPTPSVSKKPPHTQARPLATKPKPKNCNPPYYLDADGVKHLKRECL